MANIDDIFEDDGDDDSEFEGRGKCAGRCKDCTLLTKYEHYQIGYVPFETVGEYADICFVGEAPGMEELKEGKPFVGRAGSFLREELAKLKISSYHLLNAMQCHPKVGGIRTPEQEEVKFCSKNVKQFINENKPKLVIMLGKSAYEGLMNEEFYKGQTVTSISKKRPVEINGVKYAACFHPSYIVRNGGIKSPQYPDFVERLKSLVTDTHKEDVPIVPFELKKLDDLKSVLASYMKDTDLGFDYEGTSLSPFSKEFKILGFSLAALNPARATYVEFDRPITESEKKLLSMFLRRKKPWTYNVNYELKVSWANITGDFVPFNDVYIMCKVACSPGSLKDNARKHVGAVYWEELVGGIKDSFKNIFKKLDKLKKDIETIEAKASPSPKQTSQLISYKNLLNFTIEGNIKIVDNLISEDKNLLKFAKLKEDISELYKFCTTEEVERGLSKYPNEWEAIPVAMTGEYCCYDSYYTLLMKEKLWQEFKVPYPYYISQAWAGSAMEAYGMNWNDEVASKYEQYYISEANNCLFKLINLMDFGAGATFINDKNKEVVIRSTDELRLDAYTIMNDSTIADIDRLKKLKEIFNPMSNLKAKQAPFWNLYNSDFVSAITYFYTLEETILASPVVPDKALELIVKNDLNTTIRNLITCDWKSFLECNDFMSRNVKRTIEYLVGNLADESAKHTGRFAGEVLEWQFRAHKKYGGLFTTPSKDSGVDPDLKPETEWTTEFKLLYYLRRFKKVVKSLTTYINGKIGRKNVWLSTLSDTYSDPPKRMTRYFQVPKDYRLRENERWILDTDFNVCGANTLRWKAAIHTVPASSELREIYEARSSDSLFMHYDNSQSEIRLLAALSQDKALLAAFESGTDIHRYIASKIFKKAEKDVTSVERKNAKSASFALLYGKGIQAFAEELMGGDLSAATQLFDDFYKAFPQVKEWIEARHTEAKETGRVTTLFGNSINLDMADQNAAMRDAQNWPIQNGSSCLAAHCIYLNFERSTEKGFPVLPMVFTHDSHDMEFNIPNLFEVIDNVHECAVELPLQEFNIPMKIDLEIGISQGNMIKLEEVKRIGDLTRVYHFSSDESDLNPVLEKLKKHFDLEFEVTEKEKKMSSLEEMFIPKKAFSKYLGTEKTVVNGSITLSKKV